MDTGPKQLYDRSMARIIRGRSFEQLDPASQAYWQWKWDMLCGSRQREEHELLAPAPVVPPFPEGIRHVHAAPANQALPMTRIPNAVWWLCALVVVALLLGGGL